MWFHKRFDFYQMLLDQARVSEEGIRALADFMHHHDPEFGKKVDAAEKQADDVRRRIIDALNRTFVTPIDREDLFALSRAIDDMVDYAASTVEEMMLFEVRPNTHLEKMADALCQAAHCVTQAVQGLPRPDRHCYEMVIKAKKSENLMEHLYREALVDLFKNPDVISILKLREIYRHLSNAADRGNEAADILSDILVKNA